MNDHPGPAAWSLPLGSNSNSDFEAVVSDRSLTLIFRQHDDDDDEISQINEISGVDLSILSEMNIPDASYLVVSDRVTNFGVDIRRMINYLTFAKSQGSAKTYFSFG